MSKIVNGASLQPLSGAAPKQIVVLLHGFGSSGSDMIALAPTWQRGLPDALFLAPHAPQRTGFGAGYQWWALSDITPQALAAGAALAAPAIDEFIDRKLKQYGLTDAELAIVGFSQGTMMALHVGLRRANQVAGIVGYSGMLTGAARPRPDHQAAGAADPWL
jgi:phospholipase/carboxylesterase